MTDVTIIHQLAKCEYYASDRGYMIYPDSSSVEQTPKEEWLETYAKKWGERPIYKRPTLPYTALFEFDSVRYRFNFMANTRYQDEQTWIADVMGDIVVPPGVICRAEGDIQSSQEHSLVVVPKLASMRLWSEYRQGIPAEAIGKLLRKLDFTSFGNRGRALQKGLEFLMSVDDYHPFDFGTPARPPEK